MQDTLFWILVAVCIAAAMGLLSFFLWRQPRALPPEEAVDALNVLRDQRAELDAEVAAGRMTDAEREGRVAELARRVHDEGLAVAGAAGAAALPRRLLWLAAVVALLVPAIAIPVYLKVGTPAALDPAVRMAAASPHGEFTPEQLKVLLDKVRQRLEAKPDDFTGWQVLARGLQMANDFPGAAAAFARANALKPDDAELLADYADALAMAQNRTLAGKPWELIQQALKVDPKLPKALALAASAEMEQRRFESAKGYWQRLLALLPPDSEDATDIRSTIAQLDRKGSGPAAAGATPSAAGSGAMLAQGPA
ncbi:MAG: c-type cytochrome biogenesis protein CcmI, partial [Betaproteobacteria bacterium]